MSEPLIDYRADFGIYKGHNGTLSDLYSQMIPWQSAVRESLAAGEWPLWNRHMLAGSVLAANMQSAPYDPLQLLSFLLPHTQALTFCAAMTFSSPDSSRSPSPEPSAAARPAPLSPARPTCSAP